MISVTTLDRDLARIMEPRAPTPERRLAAIRGLAEAGVPCGALVAPIIPALNDNEAEAVLARHRFLSELADSCLPTKAKLATDPDEALSSLERAERIQRRTGSDLGLARTTLLMARLTESTTVALPSTATAMSRPPSPVTWNTIDFPSGRPIFFPTM